MCGISIVVNKNNIPVEFDIINAMNDRVIHRGPDDQGVFHAKNFAFGHRRLSIIDLSKDGHQPFSNFGLTITYNGEIYNYLEIKEELESLNYKFISNSDTEVILAAYKEWGRECFLKFNGMWAFSIYDKEKNILIFSRDHFGIKPLYFTITKSYFLAGSEIKQFISNPEFKPKLNKEVAAEFLINGNLNVSDNTFFQDVKELKPGHYLEYNVNSNIFHIKKWYDLNAFSPEVKDDYKGALNKVRELFLNSVRIRMRSDVKVGSCLSGGIDSSSIVSVVFNKKLATNSFSTVTSCYPNRKYDEQFFSDIVTNYTNYQSIKVYPNLDDLLNKNLLDKIIYHQDQPLMGATHFSEYKVFEAANENGLIVMLDGQGSDEYLCGYGEFYLVRIKELLFGLYFRKLAILIKQKSKLKKISVFDEVVEILRSLIVFPFVEFVKNNILKNRPKWYSKELNVNLSKTKLWNKKNTIRDLSIEEITQTSIPYQLHSQDRNSMLFSVESRLPFLDHHFVEYALGLPSHFKIKNGFTKAILRDAICELPKEIKERVDKMGFVAPDELWFKNNNVEIRLELIKAIEDTGFFTNKLLEQFDSFIEGKRAFEPIYFRVLTFNKFLQIFKIDHS